ncbi:MAG: hypothetical protein ONB33_14765, partial [candidate division KSB1 bacterium]|nr:hypothetical protein [candidate division KSB1 bacterium]
NDKKTECHACECRHPMSKGVQTGDSCIRRNDKWVPACAGMTMGFLHGQEFEMSPLRMQGSHYGLPSVQGFLHSQE